ncbi:MAG: hypothetical protein WCK35_28510 [Chloroflexota bacterium]
MTEHYPQNVINIVQEFLAYQKTVYAVSDARINEFSRDLFSYFQYLQGAGHDLSNLALSEETILGFEIYLHKCNKPEDVLMKNLFNVMLFGLFLHRKQRLEPATDAMSYRTSGRSTR